MSYQYFTRDIIHSPTGIILSKPYMVWIEDDRGEEE